MDSFGVADSDNEDMAVCSDASSIRLLPAGKVGVIRLDSLGEGRLWMVVAVSNKGTVFEDRRKVMTLPAKSALLILSSAFTITSYVALKWYLCFQHSSILIRCSIAVPWFLIAMISELGISRNVARVSNCPLLRRTV